ARSRSSVKVLRRRMHCSAHAATWLSALNPPSPLPLRPPKHPVAYCPRSVCPGGNRCVERAETSPCGRRALAAGPGTSPPTRLPQELTQVIATEPTPGGGRAAGGVVARRPQAPAGSDQLPSPHGSPSLL